MSKLYNALSRRDLIKLTAAGVATGCASSWFETMAQAAARHPQRCRSCILLWMNGGPSTIDLFDLKPGHANGGPFREIATATPGVRISEHLPRLARNMNDIAIVRSMTSREGDHQRGAYLLRTGYLQQGAISYPSLGALVAKELANDETPLPNFIALHPPRGLGQDIYSSGFLGPRYAPLVVGDTPDNNNGCEPTPKLVLGKRHASPICKPKGLVKPRAMPGLICCWRWKEILSGGTLACRRRATPWLMSGPFV